MLDITKIITIKIEKNYIYSAIYCTCTIVLFEVGIILNKNIKIYMEY